MELAEAAADRVPVMSVPAGHVLDVRVVDGVAVFSAVPDDGGDCRG